MKSGLQVGLLHLLYYTSSFAIDTLSIPGLQCGQPNCALASGVDSYNQLDFVQMLHLPM